MLTKHQFLNALYINRANDPDPEDDQGDTGGGTNDDLGTASENGDGDAV